MNRKSALGTFCLGMLAGCDTASCVRGEDTSLDCTVQSEAFMASYAGQGELLADIPDQRSYPMALVLTETGLNKLLTETVGGKVPFDSQVPIGPLQLNFNATSDPRIFIERIPYCGRCVVFKVDFSFGLINNDGEGQGSGLGKAVVTLPLSLQQNDDGTSSLMANYDKLTVDDLPFITMGIESKDQPGLQGAFEVLLTEQLRAAYGPTELLRLAPWTIGDGDIKLAARDFAIYSESRVLSFGLATNLDLPPAVSVAVRDKLPAGLPDTVPMLVQMHPGLLYGMAQRMITEGVIARRYDDQGNPDEDGLYGMTLESLAPNQLTGQNLLDVGFRVWRTAEDYCGYADAITELKLDIKNNNIAVTPSGNVRVTGGAGVGELVADDEDLVEKNKKLVENFTKDLSEQVGITINYNDLEVEGANIYFSTDGVLVGKNNIDIVIDFVVAAKE